MKNPSYTGFCRHVDEGDYKLLNNSFLFLQSIWGAFFAARFWWARSLASATDIPIPMLSSPSDFSTRLKQTHTHTHKHYPMMSLWKSVIKKIYNPVTVCCNFSLYILSKFLSILWILPILPAPAVLLFLSSQRMRTLGTSGGAEVAAAASEEALDADELTDSLAILPTGI